MIDYQSCSCSSGLLQSSSVVYMFHDVRRLIAMICIIFSLVYLFCGSVYNKPMLWIEKRNEGSMVMCTEIDPVMEGHRVCSLWCFSFMEALNLGPGLYPQFVPALFFPSCFSARLCPLFHLGICFYIRCLLFFTPPRNLKIIVFIVKVWSFLLFCFCLHCFDCSCRTRQARKCFPK